MPPAIKQLDTVSNSEKSIRKILEGQSEWFLTQNGGAPLAIQRDEFDFSAAHGRLIFSSWTEQGSQTWRITNWDWKGERLELDATRGMGREAAKLELVPRASAKAVVIAKSPNDEPQAAPTIGPVPGCRQGQQSCNGDQMHGFFRSRATA